MIWRRHVTHVNSLTVGTVGVMLGTDTCLDLPFVENHPTKPSHQYCQPEI